jgi:hypothetical protein
MTAKHQLMFLVNARTQTLSETFQKFTAPSGYLIPPAYLTKTVRQLVAALPKAKRFLTLVDNGRFDDIQVIRKQSERSAQQLAEAFEKNGIATASCPERKALSSFLVKKTDALALQIKAAAKAAPLGIELTQQLELSPSAVVGTENITGALWHSAGLELSFIRDGHKQIKEMNKRSLSATQLSSRTHLLGQVHDLPVVSATDYESAFEAGKLISASGARGFCLPFGAFMADDRTTNSYVIAGERVTLERFVPVRVIRSALVAKGLADGWQSSGTKVPEHIHLLGLGQMLILGLVAQAMTGVKLISCDATSPFKDAVAGSVYTSVPVFRRLRVAAIVWRVLKDKGTPWTCPCRWCKAQADAQDWVAAKKWFDKHAHKLRSADDLPLTRNSELSKRLPYFAIQPEAAVLQARVGHNHFAIQECVQQLNTVRSNRRLLRKRVQSWLDEYPESPSGSSFVNALTIAHDIVGK